MNRRWVTGFGILGMGALVLAAQGCSGSDRGGEEAQIGRLSLPLATGSASGTRYRLRDATFEIYGEYWGGTAGTGTGATGTGGSGAPAPITVSSEDDPDASAITLSVEQGFYTIRLLPGWRMEKVEAGTATPVEAQLLTGEYQSVYVSPQWTTWVEYEFGIGERSVWLNGNLNIGVRVYEDPSERYPTGGWTGTGGGWPGTAGSWPGTGGAATGSGGSSVEVGGSGPAIP